MSIEIIKILENDRELLYEFVKAMNNNGFFGQYSIKGNILLHLLQYNLIKNGNSEFIRLTKDIDMAMYSFKENPTKEKVLSLLKDINIEGSQIVDVEIAKEPNEFRTAWNLKCYKKYGRRKLQKVLNIDIDSKGFKNEYVKIYDIGDQKFYGSTIEKMATDKIRVISTNSLKNRVKDIFDLSILLKLGFDSSKVLSNLMQESELSDFSFLFSNVDYIKEKLSKLPVGEDIKYDVEKSIAKAFKVAIIVNKFRDYYNSGYENNIALLIKSNGYKIIGVKSVDGKYFRTFTGDIINLKGDENIEYI